MAAPILLSAYKMKKKLKTKHPLRESEISVDLKTMREFRSEILARFDSHDEKFIGIEARFDQIDKKFEQVDLRFDQIDKKFEQVDLRFEQIDKKFEQVDKRFDEMERRFDEIDKRFDEMKAYINEQMAETRAMFHKAMLILEEQNLRNKQAYDGYLVMYEKVAKLEGRLKPECFKEDS